MNLSNSCRTVLFLIFVSTVISDIRKERNLTWFEAQEKCWNRSGLTLETNKGRQFYWTGRYKRITPWIKIKGCFPDSTILNISKSKLVEHEMNQKSVGMCQEICHLENANIFAVKNYTCKCIKDEGIFLHTSDFSNKCNIQCANTSNRVYQKECGGSSFYNIFETEVHDFNEHGSCLTLQCSTEDKRFIPEQCSKSYEKACKSVDSSSNGNAMPWIKSMEDCKVRDAQSSGYLFGDVDLQNSSLACQETESLRHSSVAWVGVARQMHENTDKGWKFSEEKKVSLRKCQMCKSGKTCSFELCTKPIETSVFCTISDSTVSPISSSLSSMQMRTTIFMRTPTAGQTLLFSRNTTEHGILSNNQGSTDSSTQNKGADKDNSDLIIILPITFVLGILLISAAMLIFCLRRKNIRKNSKTEKTPVEVPSGKLVYGEKRESSCHSYFVLENLSQDISNRDQITTESPYNDTEEGEYDHLRDTRSRKDNQIFEDTYQHASAVILNDVSDYDTMANSSVIKMTEEEGTYDHAHRSVNKMSEEDGTYDHAHPVNNRNSDYGYNMPVHGSCNDNPYNIAESKS